MAKMQSDHDTEPAVADVTEFCDAECVPPPLFRLGISAFGFMSYNA